MLDGKRQIYVPINIFHEIHAHIARRGYFVIELGYLDFVTVTQLRLEKLGQLVGEMNMKLFWHGVFLLGNGTFLRTTFS